MMRVPHVERPRPRGGSRPTASWALALLLAAGLFALVVALPAALVLPALSLILVAIGLALGAGHLLAGTGRAIDTVNAYDVAGACLLVGFAAALVADAEAALAVIDRWLANARVTDGG